MRATRSSNAAGIREWAADRLVPLDLDAGDPAALRVLDEAIAAARVVYVGEPNHFIHEKYAYRSLVLRYLHSHGFRWVGEELGWADGRKIDRFLATGDSTHLDRVSIYGYEDAVRSDRDDSPTGILAESHANFPLAAFRSEQIAWAKAIRNLGENGERVRFFGFDIDALPGNGYDDIAAGVAELRDYLPELARGVERVGGETIIDEIVRLRRVAELIERHGAEIASRIGDDRARDLGYDLDSLIRSLEWVRLAKPAPDLASLAPALAHREETMARHVERVQSDHPDGKVVLFSHNLHLVRDENGIHDTVGSTGTGGSSGPGGGLVPSVGAQIAAELPARVMAVWLMYGRGHDATPWSFAPDTLTSPPGTVNAELAGLAPSFVLRLDGAAFGPLAEVQPAVVSEFGQVTNVNLAAVVDALVFVDEVTPIRAHDPAGAC